MMGAVLLWTRSTHSRQLQKPDRALTIVLYDFLLNKLW